MIIASTPAPRRFLEIVKTERKEKDCDKSSVPTASRGTRPYFLSFPLVFSQHHTHTKKGKFKWQKAAQLVNWSAHKLLVAFVHIKNCGYRQIWGGISPRVHSWRIFTIFTGGQLF
jgi:hypothetical protein